MSPNKSSKTASSVRKGIVASTKDVHGPNVTATKWPVVKYKKYGLSPKWKDRFNDIYDISGQDKSGNTISHHVIGLYAASDKDRFVINRPLFEWLAAEDEVNEVIGVYEEEDNKSIIIHAASADDIYDDWKTGNIEEDTFQTPVLLLPHDDSYWTKSEWIYKKNDLRRKTKEKKNRIDTDHEPSNHEPGDREIYYPTSWNAFWKSKNGPESAMSSNPTSNREVKDLRKVADHLGAEDVWIIKKASFDGEKLKVVVIY